MLAGKKEEKVSHADSGDPGSFHYMALPFTTASKSFTSSVQIRKETVWRISEEASVGQARKRKCECCLQALVRANHEPVYYL